MPEVLLSYPEELADALHVDTDQVTAEIRLMAAIKLFEIGRLSTGRAAELAGLSRQEFLEACSQYAVSVFNYAPDEIEAELASDMRTLATARS